MPRKIEKDVKIVVCLSIVGLHLCAYTHLKAGQVRYWQLPRPRENTKTVIHTGPSLELQDVTLVNILSLLGSAKKMSPVTTSTSVDHVIIGHLALDKLELAGRFFSGLLKGSSRRLLSSSARTRSKR